MSKTPNSGDQNSRTKKKLKVRGLQKSLNAGVLQKNEIIERSRKSLGPRMKKSDIEILLKSVGYLRFIEFMKDD